MNSMKLFKKINLKFLKENIKKSKGLLAFCLGLVPLINILILIIITTSLNNIEILDFNTVSITTYLGLFIIPLVLAVSLFGFVFKNKSVDFVLSKPLSRSTIFITNIFGGIIIITTFMLLNSLIYILFNLLFSNLIIPFSLILDYFILFLISYIFIFIVSSLSVCIAGNFMGSLVILIIILCLSPFFKALNIYYYETNPSNTYIKCNNNSCKPINYNCYKSNSCINHLEKNEYEIKGSLSHTIEFTAPFYSLSDLNDNNAPFYNSKSIIKMLILIPIYTIIGYYLFNKRKMENNETSFKNPKLHYLIKIITLLPISFICYLIIKESNEIGFIINIFIILIYSVIYDLITRKEIYKFVKSSAISLITLSIFLGIYGLYDIYMNNNTTIIKGIDSITIDDINIKKDKTYTVFNKKIKGEEIINRLIKETLSEKKEFNGNTYLITKSKNKTYRLGFSWSKETNEILEEIVRLEKLNYLKNYPYDKIDYISSNLKVTKELKSLIKNTMTNIDEYSFENYNYLLDVITYKNHEFKHIYIMPRLNKELDSYIIKKKNIEAIKYLENYNPEFSTDEDFTLFNYVLDKNKAKFINYLKNNNNEITDNTLTIYAYDIYNINILIGDKSSFKKEFAKYQESLINDEYYQSLLESYNNEEELEDYEY